MGLFRFAILLWDARTISRGFDSIRVQYFDFIVKEIRTKLGTEAVRDNVTLGGDADYALRGFQLWLFFTFLRTHPYVSEKEGDRLYRYVIFMMTSQSSKEVGGYLRMCVDRMTNYVDLISEVACPVFERISKDELDPYLLQVVASLLPFFAISSQVAIAEHFKDMETATNLESKSKIMYDKIGHDEGVPTHAMFCFNCGSSFDPETKLCLLCGVPLIFVGNGSKYHESGWGVALPESQQTETAPSPSQRKVDTASADIPQEMIEKGLYFRRYLFSNISNWEDRMYTEFGEKVVPLLGKIWGRTS
jgi:hypothetical protein